jgi:DNA primase
VNSRDRYLDKASKAYHHQLQTRNGSLDDLNGIRDYLISHGIFDKRIRDRYRLGVVGKPMTGDERFKGMLAIPYLSRAGVKAIKFRNLNGGKPKYAQHSGQSSRLYNVAAFFNAGDAIGIAEGEIDAICATERLNIPTMGIPGAEMWAANRAIWTPIFKNFTTVYIFRDGDDAGRELADAVSSSLKWRARVIDPPDGEDVGSMIAAGRAQELLDRMPRDEDEDGSA